MNVASQEGTSGNSESSCAEVALGSSGFASPIAADLIGSMRRYRMGPAENLTEDSYLPPSSKLVPAYLHLYADITNELDTQVYWRVAT